MLKQNKKIARNWSKNVQIFHYLSIFSKKNCFITSKLQEKTPLIFIEQYASIQSRIKEETGKKLLKQSENHKNAAKPTNGLELKVRSKDLQKTQKHSKRLNMAHSNSLNKELVKTNKGRKKASHEPRKFASLQRKFSQINFSLTQ